MQKGEDALVAWLRERFRPDAVRVPIGIGDDMAAVRLDGRLVAITADMLLDGVHFDTAVHGYESIGRKAIACSLSDCAGMACHPRAATVSVALPEAMSPDDVCRMYEGMAGVADEFCCAIVGGDTTSWAGKLAIDVAMLAEPMSPRGPITRSGARPDDAIYVSGPLGGSISGKHMTFVPRVELASRLAEEPDVHAMMDISDGLALDLYRLCTASACDAELSGRQLENVIADAARERSRIDGRSPLDHALSDGEDFELLVIGGPALSLPRLGLMPVGRVLPRASPAGSRMVISRPDGQQAPLEPRGYEHFR